MSVSRQFHYLGIPSSPPGGSEKGCEMSVIERPGVAMAGLADGDRALILIKHDGIDRAEVWAVLERRWPEVGLCDPRDIEPSAAMSAEDAASLARCRRGVDPLRIVILEQAAASLNQLEEAMPFLF
jgi:hypothetical protein